MHNDITLFLITKFSLKSESLVLKKNNLAKQTIEELEDIYLYNLNILTFFITLWNNSSRILLAELWRRFIVSSGKENLSFISTITDSRFEFFRRVFFFELWGNNSDFGTFSLCSCFRHTFSSAFEKLGRHN